MITPADLLREMFSSAVSAALPDRSVQQHLPPSPAGRTVVVGAGKSAAAMAKAVEDHWAGSLSGLVVTRYGHSVPTQQIEVVEAAHPVPDENGAIAASRILEQVQGLTADDLVICLISGGGSALLTLPPSGVTLAELATLSQHLLRSGADIAEMNAVRKTISQAAGGRLASTAFPAPVYSLIISDVPGDDLKVIASGPTVGDIVTTEDAQQILSKYQIPLSPALQDYLDKNPNPVVAPDDRRLSRTQNVLIARPQQSLEVAAQVAQKHGYAPLILGDSLEGEAKEVGRVHAGIVRQVLQHQQPIAPPCVILSGGETTVTVQGQAGRGGRNTEFLLSMVHTLGMNPRVAMLACDTDGIDGSESSAGALVTADHLKKAADRGLKPNEYLAAHDSYSFFEAIDALVTTGPTLTNVNDFRAIAITPPEA